MLFKSKVVSLGVGLFASAITASWCNATVIFSEDWESYSIETTAETANGWDDLSSVPGPMYIHDGGTAPGGNPSKAAFARSSGGALSYTGQDLGTTYSTGEYILTATLGRSVDGTTVGIGLTQGGTSLASANTYFFLNQTDAGGGQVVGILFDSGGAFGGETSPRPVISNANESRNVDVRITFDLDADTLLTEWKYSDEATYAQLSNNPALNADFAFDRIIIGGAHLVTGISGVPGDDGWIDDITLSSTEIPEPASMLIMGAGLALVMNRRKNKL